MRPNRNSSSATADRGGHAKRGRLMRMSVALSVTGIFLLAAIYMLSWARVVVIPFAVAITIALTLGPLAQRMERRLPPALVSPILLFALMGIVFGLFASLSIPAQHWSTRLPEMEMEIKELLTSFKGSFQKLDEISKSFEEARETVQGRSDSADKPLDVAVQRFSLIGLVFTSVPIMVAQVIMFIGGFYFFMAYRDRLRQGMLLMFRNTRHRLRTARILRDIEYFLYRYVAAITVVNIGLGVVTGLVMYGLGMPTPQLWGALAAILNFIPYLGPACVTVVLAGVGLVTFDPVWAALTPAGVFICLNILESQFVTPHVVGNSLTLNPFLVFFSLAFWAWMWGPIGAFLAVPLLIMMVVAGMHLLVHEPRPGPATFGKPVAALGNGWLPGRFLPAR